MLYAVVLNLLVFQSLVLSVLLLRSETFKRWVLMRCPRVIWRATLKPYGNELLEE